MAIDHVLPQSLDDLYGPGAENADDDEASIDTFLAEYDADSGVWWTLSTGEMQQKFEQLRDLFGEAFSLLNNIVESVTSHGEGDYFDTRVDAFEIEEAEKWLSKR